MAVPGVVLVSLSPAHHPLQASGAQARRTRWCCSARGRAARRQRRSRPWSGRGTSSVCSQRRMRSRMSVRVCLIRVARDPP